MAAFRIRPAEPADTGAVFALVRGLAEYERLGHEMVATESDLAGALFGARPAVEALIAEWQGEAVGLALFFTTYSTFRGRPGLYLEDLFVLPKARGNGIGKGLLAALAALALRRGCIRVDWSVLDWNEPALEFYRSLGAAPRGQWTVYSLRDAALSGLAEGATNSRDRESKPKGKQHGL